MKPTPTHAERHGGCDATNKCPLCDRRLATDADLYTVPEGEDGGLCWANFAGECVIAGKPNYAEDVIRDLRSELNALRAENDRTKAERDEYKAVFEMQQAVIVAVRIWFEDQAAMLEKSGNKHTAQLFREKAAALKILEP